MRFTKEKAKELEVLLDPQVETAILKLLEHIKAQEESVLNDSTANADVLKLFQGKYLLIQSLKQYKNALLAAHNTSILDDY